MAFTQGFRAHDLPLTLSEAIALLLVMLMQAMVAGHTFFVFR